MRRPSRTALFAAAKAWDAATITALLKQAPELAQATDAKDRTALHIACGVQPNRETLLDPHGLKTAAALLKAGADLHAVQGIPDGGEIFPATALWWAASWGNNPKLVDFLLTRGASADHCLWAIVWRDDAPMMKRVLKTSPKLDHSHEGETAIFYAARLKRLQTLGLLIKAGADPTIKDAKGRTAVEIAKARRLPKDYIARLEALAAKR